MAFGSCAMLAASLNPIKAQHLQLRMVWRRMWVVSAWGTHSCSTIGWITAIGTSHIRQLLLFLKTMHVMDRGKLHWICIFCMWKGCHPRECFLSQATMEKLQLYGSPLITPWWSICCWVNIVSERAMKCVKVLWDGYKEKWRHCLPIWQIIHLWLVTKHLIAGLVF